MSLLVPVAMLFRQPVGQVLAGPVFERFAARADHQCPARHLRSLKPAELDGMEESFDAALSARQRGRILAADHFGPRCSQEDHGATCGAIGRLEAIRRTGALESFVSFACTHA